MQELFLIALLMLVVAYWWDATRSNELALVSCRRVCRNRHR